jgi:pimeloyl-ACP methyl ester carboxylesterase
MATLGGHGLGGKIALAAASYNFDRVTGYFGIDTTPTNQHYFEPYQELRGYISALRNVALNRPFSSISHELRQLISCPKWRQIFESNLTKGDHSYNWKFNLDAIYHNVKN